MKHDDDQSHLSHNPVDSEPSTTDGEKNGPRPVARDIQRGFPVTFCKRCRIDVQPIEGQCPRCNSFLRLNYHALKAPD